MATEDKGLHYVETTPPPIRRPPVIELGALGWIKRNLFSTWYDALMTVISVAFIFFAARGLLIWVVGTAEWSVVTNNLRLFSAGRYPPDQVWRVQLALMIVTFMAGISWGIWGRMVRLAVILIVVVIAALFIMPIFAEMLPIRPIYTLVTAEGETIPAMAFVADPGDEITFTLTPVTDETIMPVGFMDMASRIAWGQIELERNTAQEETETPQEGEGEDTPEPAAPPDLIVHVQLLDANLELLSEFEAPVEGGEYSTTIRLPDAGWYLIVVDKEGTAGAMWMAMEPLEPLKTDLASETAREERYGPVPEVEGRRTRVLDAVYLRFAGVRTLGDFISLHIGPFAEALKTTTLILFAVLGFGYIMGTLGKAHEKLTKRLTLIGWVLSFPLVVIVLRGFGNSGWLPYVSTDLWGGLLLTLILAIVGIVAAFPIGVLLALGRRSNLPVVKIFSTLYIELIRGVPLVTVLFTAQLMVPLLDPSLANVDNVVRAMVGMTMFSAAYLAENVRGGLQSIPKGQIEAAKALGMNDVLVTALIVLPQALRAVIPAIVGQFIALFKDTSLVYIVGLLELLGIARTTISQPEYVGLQREVFVFIAIIYFVFSYAMSEASRKLEESGAGAVRRR